MPRYSLADYACLLDKTFSEVRDLAHVKGGEYSGREDRLANFRRNGAALGLPMETVWAVYAAKHWDAIMQFIADLQAGEDRPTAEPIEGRVLDLITYLTLFLAMLEERGGKIKDNHLIPSHDLDDEIPF